MNKGSCFFEKRYVGIFNPANVDALSSDARAEDKTSMVGWYGTIAEKWAHRDDRKENMSYTASLEAPIPHQNHAPSDDG